MSQSRGASQLVSLFVTALIGAVTFVYFSSVMPDLAFANEPRSDEPRSLGTNSPRITPYPGTLSGKPVYVTARDTLNRYDHLAALEAVQIALSRVGDGDSYVWRRIHGRLNGVIQPTKSYKDRRGRVCRHVIVLLNSGNYSRKREGIACRQINGIWSLDG